MCKRYKVSPEIAASATYLEELYTRDLGKEVNKPNISHDIKPTVATRTWRSSGITAK